MNLSIPNKDFEGFIFDCDGTLADTMPLHLISWQEAIDKNGGDFIFTDELFQSLAGMGSDDTVNFLNNKFGSNMDPDQTRIDKGEFYKILHPKTKPIEDVVNFAKQKKNQGFPIAVCSGGTKTNVHGTLEITGIKEIFDVILTQEDVSNGKPHPEMFLKAADLLKVDPTKCLVFEDAPMGLKAAEAAEMDWVLVPSTLKLES